MTRHGVGNSVKIVANFRFANYTFYYFDGEIEENSFMFWAEILF